MATLNWPKRISVGSSENIKIKYLSRKKMDMENPDNRENEIFLGRAFLGKELIHIATEYPPCWVDEGQETARSSDEIMRTLIHEIMHFISNEYQMNFTERDVNILENELIKLFRVLQIIPKNVPKGER